MLTIYHRMSVADETGLFIKMEPNLKVDPLTFSHQICNTIQQAADESAIQWHPIFSGAGHDTQVVGKLAPIGMIFVPSGGGRTHCPE